jgi:PAS domain S-box-containing protein
MENVPMIYKPSYEELEQVVRELEGRIAELSRTEELLLKEKDFSEAIILGLPGIFYLFDDGGKFVRWNKNLETASDYSTEEISEMHPLDFFGPEDKKIVAERIEEAFVTGESAVEADLISKSGKRIPYYFTGLRAMIGGNPYLVGMGLDLSERKRMEEELRGVFEESQQRHKEISALLEGSRGVLQHGEFIDAAKSIFGSCKHVIGATSGYVALLSRDGTENEVLFLESGGRPCRVDPDLPMPIRGLRAAAYQKAEAVYDNDFSHSEWSRFLPEGHVTLDNVLFAPLIIDGRVVGLLGLANKPGGFTENDARLATAFGDFAAMALSNSRTWELLESKEERFRSVVETANDAIITIDAEQTIVSLNEAGEKIFGYPSDVVGQKLPMLMPERFREAHCTGMKRLIETGGSRLIGKTAEMIGLRKNGEEFPLELSLASWNTRDGVFFTGIVRDITDRKKAERALKKAHEELKRFVEAVAHDLKNPIFGIQGFSGLLMKKYHEELADQGRRYVDQIQSNALQMSGLVSDLLTLSRIGQVAPDLKLIPSGEIVENAAKGLQYMISEKGIAVVVGENLPAIYCDKRAIYQVFENLLSNAVKSVQTVSNPRIEIGWEDGGPDHHFHVKDNGIGIAPEDHERVFDMFCRLDRKSGWMGGTGLGLAIVHKIVMNHGGKVWIESELGQGATFHFTLPKQA